MISTWDEFEARTVWRFGGFELSCGDFPGTISAFLTVFSDAVNEFVSDLVDVFVWVLASFFGLGIVECRTLETSCEAQSPNPVRRYIIRPKALHGSIAILAPPNQTKGPGQKMSP